MPTYLVKSAKQIIRHEGDFADVAFTVPAALSLAAYDVRFVVKDNAGRTIMRKDTADGSITVASQEVMIPLLPADTKGKSGTHKWEAEVYDADGPVTIGYGQFVINAELIK